MVRKKDNKLEPFYVKKIRGLQKACEKRPITMDQINELAGLVATKGKIITTRVLERNITVKQRIIPKLTGLSRMHLEW